MPLVQEAKGYEFKGRMPAGRCIIEERNNTGKLSIWAQDLKPETKYGVFLVFDQEQHYLGLHMGPFDVNANGKAEFRREISQKDLHNFVLKEVLAVAIIAADDPGVVSPLCGYRSTQVSWRHRFSVWKKEEPATIPAAEETMPEVLPKQDPPEKHPITVEQEHAPATTPEQPEVIEPEPIPVENPDHTPTIEVPIPPRAKKPSESLTSPSVNPEETLDPNQPHTNTIQLIEAIFNGNIPCEPFAKQNHEIKWVRCNLLEQIPLPNDSPHLMSEPFMQAAWADYEHFILGITIDTQPAQYVIGIPGTYTQGNKAIAKRLGFLKFKCHKKDRPSIGSDGYWLMFVDL